MIFWKLFKIGLLLFLGVSIVACDEDYTQRGNDPTKISDLSAIEELLRVEKCNRYIEFYQNQSTEFIRILDSYLEENSHNKLTNPFENNRNIIPIFENIEDIKSVISNEPILSIDDEVNALILLGEELDIVMESAWDYYQNQEYLHDNYVKAQQIHSKIINISPAFYRTYYALERFVMNEERIKRKQELAKLKNEREWFSYQHLSLLDNADAIMNLILGGDRMEVIDLNILQHFYSQFESDLIMFENLVNNSKKNYKKSKEETLSDEILKTSLTFQTNILLLIENLEGEGINQNDPLIDELNKGVSDLIHSYTLYK